MTIGNRQSIGLLIKIIAASALTGCATYAVDDDRPIIVPDDQAEAETEGKGESGSRGNPLKTAFPRGNLAMDAGFGKAINPDLPAMAAAEDIRLLTPEQSYRFGDPSKAKRPETEVKLAAEEQVPNPSYDARHVVVTFQVDDRGIRPIRSMVAPGEAQVQRYVSGRFVWVAWFQGEPVAAGSARDPRMLSTSVFPPGGPPAGRLPRAESGEFRVALPGIVLEENVLERMELRFFDIGTDFPPNIELDPKTIEKATANMERIERYKGSTLQKFVPAPKSSRLQ